MSNTNNRHALEHSLRVGELPNYIKNWNIQEVITYFSNVSDWRPGWDDAVAIDHEANQVQVNVHGFPQLSTRGERVWVRWK